MTLVVEYSDFVAAVKRYADGNEPCVCHKRVGDSIHLTYVNPETAVQIVSFFVGKEAAVKEDLGAHGLCTLPGTWVTEASLEHLAQIAGDAYIAAVAYDTRRGPGLWMDAFPTPPAEGTVLRAIFEEFVAEGLIAEDQFEEFLQDARPLVRILEPRDIERFMKGKPKP